MDRKVLLALYDMDQRIDMVYPELYKELTGGVVRFIGPPERPGSNFISYSRLQDEVVDQVIREQIAFFSRLGIPFEWKVFEHDSPPDLRERLMQHGFRPGKHNAIMVMNIQQPHSFIYEESDVDIRRLKTPQEIAEMIELLSGVWQIDFQWLEKILVEDLWKRPEYCSVYMAYVNGIPASAGWAQFPPNSQFASLWGGTTAPQYRGYGLYKALIAVRALEAVRRGYNFLTIDASQKSRQIAEKNGFQLLTFSHPCYWDPDK